MWLCDKYLLWAAVLDPSSPIGNDVYRVLGSVALPEKG